MNRKKRLQFAKKYLNKDIEFWKKVIFVDESKFCLYRNDMQCERLRRKSNTALNLKNSETVKHYGTNVMVWGSMSYNGVGNMVFKNKILNKYGYLTILKEN